MYISFIFFRYDPLNKFMLLKQLDGATLGRVFEMVITPELEYPLVCVNVRRSYQPDHLKLDLINMNSGASWFHSDELEDMDGTGIAIDIYSLLFIFFPLKGTFDSFCWVVLFSVLVCTLQNFELQCVLGVVCTRRWNVTEPSTVESNVQKVENVWNSDEKRKYWQIIQVMLKEIMKIYKRVA